MSVFHAPTTANIDDYFDIRFNRLILEDAAIEPEILSDIMEPEEVEDIVTPTDWRVSVLSSNDKSNSNLLTCSSLVKACKIVCEMY